MTASDGEPRLRRALENVPTYRPGRPAPGGGTVVTLYKLSSNENPYPPLPGVLEAAAEAAAEMNRYPDMYATELVAAVAEHLDVPELDVVPGTGTVGVLKQVVQTVAGEGDEVVYAWRSFEAYPIFTGVAGATSVQVPLDRGARHDLEALADAINDRTRLVIVCSPNNPTGPVVHKNELNKFLVQVPSDVLIVIDEAYAELVRDPEAANGLDVYRQHGNVCVLRTFSKAYGLAGLRVGYAVAHDAVADALRKTAVPFGVSTIAQQAAIASLQRKALLLERVDQLVTERTRVVDALRAQGWAIPDTEANFVWFELGDETARFAQHCADHGLAVRPYAPDGCRVTIGEPAANDQMLAASQEWIEQHQ